MDAPAPNAAAAPPPAAAPAAPPPPEGFTPAQREVGKRTILLDGVFSKLMDTLTSGVFLAGLGVYLGASNAMIGLLASLPFLAQLAQVGAVKLLLRAHDRRRVVVVSTTLARLVLLAIAVLVLGLRDGLPAEALVALIAFAAATHVVSTAAWNWWMRDLVPRDELGRYFGRRLALTTLLGAAALLVAGVFLDALDGRGRVHVGYAVLYGLGFLAGMVSTAYLARTPHVPPVAPRREGKPLALIAHHARDPANRVLVVGLMLASAALTFSLPFTAVYLLRGLGYGYAAVTALAVLSQLAYVSGLRGWGHLGDRFGNRPVLLIAYGMLLVALAGWALASGERGWVLFGVLVVLHFLVGFSVGGIELSTHNVLLKMAPDSDAPAYLAAMNLTKSMAAGVATLAAGVLWQVLGAGEVVTFGVAGTAVWTLRGFHVLSLVAFGLGLLGLLVLRFVAEPGAAPSQDVAKAMRREAHMLSSVAGIRAFVHVVSYVVEAFVAAERAPRRGRVRRRRGPGSDAPAASPTGPPR